MQLKPRTSSQKDKEVVQDKSPLFKIVTHAQACAAEKRTAVINHEDWGFLSIGGKSWMLSLFKGAGFLIADGGKPLSVDLKNPKFTHTLTLAIGYDVSSEGIQQVVVVDLAEGKKSRHSYRVPEPAMRGTVAMYCVKKGCNLSVVL